MQFNYLSVFILLFITSNVFSVDGDLSKGKSLSQICTTCHGMDGNSVNPIWPKLADQHASYIIKQLHDFKNGKRVNAQMTGMVAKLSDEDMQHLAAYYASQKNTGGSANPETVEAGRKIYHAGDSESGIPACMACHGPAGEGNPGALYPSLAGQHAEYTITQLKMFKAEKRDNDANAIMRSIAGAMTNAQIEAVSEYIQGLY